MIPNKLETLENISKRANLKERMVFTNGCFDILHVGHSRYLEEAKGLGDFLVVGLNSDASVKRLKGQERPINTQAERAEMLLALKAVDYVIVFDEDTPLELIKELEPRVLVKGGDWAVDQIVGHEIVLELGGEVQSLTFHPGRSTTKLVETIQKL